MTALSRAIAVDPVQMFNSAMTTEDAKLKAAEAEKALLLARAAEMIKPLRLAFGAAVESFKTTKNVILTVDDVVPSLEYDSPIGTEFTVAVYIGHKTWVKHKTLTVFGVREKNGSPVLQHYRPASCGMVASDHVFDNWIAAYQHGIKAVAKGVMERLRES